MFGKCRVESKRAPYPEQAKGLAKPFSASGSNIFEKGKNMGGACHWFGAYGRRRP